MTYYPDTTAGVREMLRDVSSLNKAEIESLELVPDPLFDGCWLARGEHDTFICYVSDHIHAPDIEEVEHYSDEKFLKLKRGY